MVLGHPGLVLVDFTAEWCPPCRMIRPVLDAIASERSGTLTVYQIDTDENPRTVAEYRILSQPTLMLFRDGRPLLTLVGARSKTKLLAEIDAALRD
ncbi:thiol reductase thioredoxin [Nocardia sp. ET3-3]|uniref:Thiol reductase thioredoxin n=2 Tax=Nocardia terrae TaxID=2675851 RepID=A0A7K1UWN5_9NOCA|nr:thiol reductase thioredoxin [Nocardia terrae]